MNLTEQANRAKIKTALNNKRSHHFVHKPLMGFKPRQRKIHNKRDSTPSSKTTWGKSHQSITSSNGVNTEASSKEDARIIIALSEGRGEARCEVGIAVINVSQPHLILCQISDTQSYDNTLRKINIFNPSQILVPMTFVESATQSRLIEKVKEQFPLVNCTAVRRNTYNKACGMEYVQELCVSSLNSVLLVLQHRYYALTAASALLKFLHNNLNIFYASGSIKIDYQESEGYAIIDVSTADRLELVSSTRPFQASKYSTLFGVLNNCYTRIGERALRTILLQPPFATSIILERQDSVTALVNRPEKLQAIQVMLQKIGNIDQLLTLPTLVVDDSQYWSERQLNYMLYLNGLTDLIMTFSEVVIDFEEAIFTNFCSTLKSQDFLTIRDTVRTLIHENAYSAKSHNGLTQRCFAIKAGINGLLDLVRKIYSERLDDMREYVKVLGEKYDLPLTLGNNVSKGYHIVLSLNKHQRMSMKKSDLPKECIQVCRLAGSFTMKTMEIINFQTRIDDIVADIMKISNVMIFRTLSSFKKYMGLFHKLCEHISNIDVIQSLAEVSIRNNYIKPTFGEYTEVKDSQHPMLEMLAHEKPVPNLISSCKDFNIHIITGPNGSGKSIFIRQVMLLQIMSQIGGYVPASSAVFRPADRLFARVYLEDNMECGASSFVLEIKEVIYIMSHITDHSLIIMDELGRSTSLEEGSALAMAICERLADSSAFVYLTSHFTLVTKLGDLYLNIKNWYMDTEASGNTPRSLKLDFKYTLKIGVTNLKRYGIFMVKTLWPTDILEDVYAMLEKKSRPHQEANAQKISKAIRQKYELESNLRKLKAKSQLKLSEVHKLINQYRNELESQNIRLQNIKFVDNTSQYLQNMDVSEHYSEHYLDDDVSDEVLSKAADSILYSPTFSQNYTIENNETRASENSSYKQLSRFIDEDSKNLNLLNPDIQITLADSKQNQIFEEEMIPMHERLRFSGENSRNFNLFNPDIQITYADCEQNQLFEEEINPMNEHLGFLRENSRNLNLLNPDVQITFADSKQNRIFKEERNTMNESLGFLKESRNLNLLNPDAQITFADSKQNQTFEEERNPMNESLRFLGGFSRNLDLSSPNMRINYPDFKLNQITDEEINPMNRSLLVAVEKEAKTEKINILSNILINKDISDDKALIESRENVFENLPHSTRAYFRMNEYADYINSSQEMHSQESEKMNAINRSLLMEKNSLTKHYTERTEQNACKNTPDGNFSTCLISNYEVSSTNLYSQSQDEDYEIFKSPGYSFRFRKHPVPENINHGLHEFEFPKPVGSPFRRRIEHRTEWSENFQKIENLDTIDQFQFSLPLLQNQGRTSTPIKPDTINFAEDSFANSRPFAFNMKGKQMDVISTDKTIAHHLFPEIKILEGPNDRTLSFGEEDKKIGEPPFPTESIGEQCDRNKEGIYGGEGNHDFEELIKQEIKIFLSDSTDIFDGDVDSLKITVENYEKTDPLQKIKVVTKDAKDKNNEFIYDNKGNQKELDFSSDGQIRVDSRNYPSKIQDNSKKTAGNNNKLAEEIVYRTNLSPSDKIIVTQDFEREENSISNTSESHGTIMLSSKNINSNDVSIRIVNIESKGIENIRHEKKCSYPKQSNYIIHDDHCTLTKYQNIDFSAKDDTKNLNNNKEKVTTSISEASRQRNLDISSSGKSTDSKRQSKVSNIKETTTTDISSASRQRNLDNLSSITKNENSSQPGQTDESPSSDSSKIGQKLSSIPNRNMDFTPSLNESRLIDGKKNLVISENRERKFSTSSSSKYYETADEMGLTGISERRNLDQSSSTDEMEQDSYESRRFIAKDFLNKNVAGQKIIVPGENSNYCYKTIEFEQSLDSEKNSNYKSANEDSCKDNFEIISKTPETRRIKRNLGYTRRPFIGITTSNKKRTSSDLNDVVKTKKRKSKVGPFKLTKNEIREEFNKQDQILLQEDMDISTYSRYLNQRMNRPSVRQLQNAEHIATIRKTDNGTLVLPAKKRTLKSRKYVEKTKIAQTTNCFDMSIFSDQNADKMSAFLASSERNYSMFKFDATKELLPSKTIGAGFCSQVARKKKFERTSSLGEFRFHDFTKIIQNQRIKFGGTLNSPVFLEKSQGSEGSSVFIPDGYFKTNKKDIENICSKYLTRTALMYKAKTSPI